MDFDWREIVSRSAMVAMGGICMLLGIGVIAFFIIARDMILYDGVQYIAGFAVFLLAAGGWLIFNAFRPPFKES